MNSHGEEEEENKTSGCLQKCTIQRFMQGRGVGTSDFHQDLKIFGLGCHFLVFDRES